MKRSVADIFSGIRGFFFRELPAPGKVLKTVLALFLAFPPAYWFGVLKITDPLHHNIYFYDSALLNVIWVFLPLFAGILLLFRNYPPVLTFPALCALAGAVLTAVFPSFTSLSLSLTFYAAAIWLSFDDRVPEFSRNRFYAAIPVLLFVFVFASGVEQQFNAYNRLILYYNDWALYYAGYRKLAEAPFNGVLQWLSTGNHFNPSVNLLMSGIIKCFPGAETIFVVNSLAIASMVPLIYLLGRILKLPAQVCALCSAALAFNPLFSNQHTALMYSYHPINFLPAAFLLFCIAKEKGSRAGMITAGLFMCGIKETVFIFASGAAFLPALKRKWIWAAAVLFLCAGAFFFVTSVLLPLCDGTGNYFQLFQYKSLGNSSGGLLLSPFLAPRIFWGKIFNPANLSFILLLLLPFFPAFRYAPRFLLAALPLVLGVLLKDHYLNRPNIVQQYGVEISVWLTAAMIYGARTAFAAKRFSAGMAAALLIASLTGYYFVGKTPVGGTYSASAIRQTPDVRKLREHIKKLIPASASVAASMKWGAQLAESHRNLILDLSSTSADFTVLDFSDSSAGMAEMMRIRDKFLTEGLAHPVGFLSLRACQVVIFKKGRGPWQLPFIAAKPPEKILPYNPPLTVDIPGVRARAIFLAAQNKMLICTAVEKNFKSDLSLQIAIFSGKEKKYWSLRWGYGLFPAYLMKPDQSFVIEIPLPRHWKTVSGLEIKGTSFERK